MQVQQKYSITLVPKWNKAGADGRAPIYIRIKIDDEQDEISLGCKTAMTDWDPDTRRVRASHPSAKLTNKKVDRSLVDIDRHFDRVQAKDGKATPAAVKASYIGPKKESRPPVKERAALIIIPG